MKNTANKQYPKKIRRSAEPEYIGVFVGVQPLTDGDEFPLYRFPGGVCCQDPFENGIEIVEE